MQNSPSKFHYFKFHYFSFQSSNFEFCHFSPLSFIFFTIKSYVNNPLFVVIIYKKTHTVLYFFNLKF